MFDNLMVELILADIKKTQAYSQEDQFFSKPFRARASLVDRVLPAVGDVMIRVGSKLKDRSHTPPAGEQVHSPNFLIML